MKLQTCHNLVRLCHLINFQTELEKLMLFYTIILYLSLPVTFFVILLFLRLSQADLYPFNRGKLMNVGFNEAKKKFDFDCFVFHDVDLIPENDRNDYGCPSSPRHMSAAIDKFEYKYVFKLYLIFLQYI